ncbi:MAG: hypothetical protein AAGD38_04155 [Acidobacteriota bacterium]
MNGRYQVWRDRLWWWAVPAVLFAIALLALLYYNQAFAGQAEALEAGFEAENAELAALSEEARRARDLLERINGNRAGIEHLYRDRFATEAERFTRMIIEIKELARRAGLRPTSFNYPDEPIEELGLIRRSVDFQVEGTYDQLRTFINFLELTEQFVILNQVELVSGQGAAGSNPSLSIALEIDTVFAADEDVVEGAS